MSQLEELIERCDAVLAGEASEEEAKLIIVDYFLGYEKTLRNTTPVTVAPNGIGSYDLPTIRNIRTILRAYQERLDHQLMIAGASASRSSLSMVQTQTVTTTITYTQTIDLVNEMPSSILSIDQKQELAKLLQGVEKAGKNESKLKKACKSVADWMFDNAIKAVPTVMPYVTQAIQRFMA